jgi:predicted DNA-binding protein (MmcQ/YjbR family)
MNIESFRNYCLAKKGVTEGCPFGPEVLVFKVMGKMFALAPIGAEELTINLKCDPERAIELREQHDEVQPGYHMNKQHWNTISCEGSLPDKLLYELTDHSYDLIVKSLPKRLLRFI